MKQKSKKYAFLDTVLLWWFCSYTTISFFDKYLENKNWDAIEAEIINSILKLFPDRSALYVTWNIILGILMLYFSIFIIIQMYKSTKKESIRALNYKKYLPNPYNTNFSFGLSIPFTIKLSSFNSLIKLIKNYPIEFLCISIDFILALIILTNRMQPNGSCSVALTLFPILTAYILHRLLPKIIDFKDEAPLSHNTFIRTIGLLLFGIAILQIVN